MKEPEHTLVELYLSAKGARSLYNILGKLPIASLTQEELDQVNKMRYNLAFEPAVGVTYAILQT